MNQNSQSSQLQGDIKVLQHNEAQITSLEDKDIFTSLLRHLPPLSDRVKQVIVKALPWISILVVIGTFIMPPFLWLSMPSCHAGHPEGQLCNTGVSYTVEVISKVLFVTLEVLAIRGLFQRKRKAWWLLFAATLVSGINNFLISAVLDGTYLPNPVLVHPILLTLFLYSLSPLTVLLETLGSLYVLVQIRKSYR